MEGKFKKNYMLPYRLPFSILPLRANSKYKQPEGHIQGADLTEGFLCFEFRGPVVGGAHSKRGSLSEFYGIDNDRQVTCKLQQSYLH